MLLALLLFSGLYKSDLTKNPIWEYHLRQLHGSIESRDWYTAKRSLHALKDQNAAIYDKTKLDATAGWVAFQEGNWETAYRTTQSLGAPSGWSLLDMGLSLEKMGRHERVLELIAESKLSSRSPERWNIYALQARCHEALGNPQQAIKSYKKMRSRHSPAKYQALAGQALMVLYYQTDRTKKARNVAEGLQIRHPDSDAALFAVNYQDEHETEAYLSRPIVWDRFAKVCYRNRDFDNANRFFERLAQGGNAKQAARARYFLCHTHNKQGNPQKAQTAFEAAMPMLRNTSFEGPAAFQYARSLFMNGHDDRVIRFTEDYWRNGQNRKWRRECLRLLILSLRRSNDHPAFQRLALRLRGEATPHWLSRLYHRNGTVWAMQTQDYHGALDHLQSYRNHRLNANQTQEANLWEGLIWWQLDNREKALDRWLRVVAKDPNHFFGLVARELIQSKAGETDYWTRRWQTAEHRLDRLSLKALRELYFLAPDTTLRERVGGFLKSHLPEDSWLHTFNGPVLSARARELAEVGRYDLAVRYLEKKKNHRLAYHYLKSKWFMMANNLHDSIRHAEILIKAYPTWAPYELIPEQVQQLVYPKGFADIVLDKASAYRVDPYLLLAIIREESRFDAGAKSWASARGLMQFIPETAREIAGEVRGLDHFVLPMLYDPHTSITLGARYVEKLMETFGGVSVYTIAAYNAGEDAVQRWRQFSGEDDAVNFVWDVTYDQTKNYCQKVMRAYHHYTRVYEKDRSSPLRAPQTDPPSYRRSTP